METKERLWEKLSKPYKLKEGDVIFAGDAIKPTGVFEDFVDSMLSDFPSSICDYPAEDRIRAYLVVDASGKIMYNSLEGGGFSDRVLRKMSFVYRPRPWHKKIQRFEYDSAFRVQNNSLQELNGNLYRFCLEPKEMTLRDLDFRDIREFLKVGDFSFDGIITIR